MKTNTPYQADIEETVKLFPPDAAEKEHFYENTGGRYENAVRIGEKRYFFSDPEKPFSDARNSDADAEQSGVSLSRVTRSKTTHS